MIPSDSYRIPELEEYIRQGEPSKRERSLIWQTAIGLQQVDGLHVSDYLLQTAKRNIEGEISGDEAQQLIHSYYKSASNRTADKEENEEADKAAVNINRILVSDTLNFSTNGFIALHRRIFQGIFKHAGSIRDYDITKQEFVLRGDSVRYLNWEDLRRALDYDLQQEKAFSYAGLSSDEMIAHIAQFVADLWQIHPFREGNTRTTAVFTILYLRSIGFAVNNDLFANNSWYFRNALVRANYKNAVLGIEYQPVYLQRFFRNVLLNENNVLLNREMHLDWSKSADQLPQSAIQSAAQSAKNTDKLPPKCKNCTLGELAVLRIIQQNPSATQKQIAEQIGKSERTVKTLTVRLTEKEIIIRRNGKRNGYWEIL